MNRRAFALKAFRAASADALRPARYDHDFVFHNGFSIPFVMIGVSNHL